MPNNNIYERAKARLESRQNVQPGERTVAPEDQQPSIYERAKARLERSNDDFTQGLALQQRLNERVLGGQMDGLTATRASFARDFNTPIIPAATFEDDEAMSAQIDDAIASYEDYPTTAERGAVEAYNGITDNILNGLERDNQGRYVYNGVPYEYNAIRESLYPVVASRSYRYASENVDGFMQGQIAREYGQSYQNVMRDYLDRVIPDLEARIREMRDEIAEEERGDFHSREAFISPEAYAGAFIGNQASVNISTKPYDDLLERIASIRNNDFSSGFDEGFDWANVYTLGLADLGWNIRKENVLSKVENGEALTQRERLLFDLMQFDEDIASLVQESGYQFSLGNKVGTGLGVTTEMALPMVMTMGATSGIGTMGRLGSWASAKVALRGGVKATARFAGRNALTLGRNVGLAYARGAAAAPFMPSTWAGYTEERLSQYRINEDGSVKFSPKNDAMMFLGAYIDSMNEITSEHIGVGIGDIITGGTSLAGRLFSLANRGTQYLSNKLHLDRVGQALHLDGLGRRIERSGVGRGMREVVSRVDSPVSRRMLANLGYAGAIAEPLSEIYGDLSANAMRDLAGLSHDYSQFSSPDYWLSTALVSTLYGGALTLPGRTAQLSSVARLGTQRRRILERISNEELTNKLLSITRDGGLDRAAIELANIDWTQYSAADRAYAFDFVRLNYSMMTIAGATRESQRMAQYMANMRDLTNRVYKDGDSIVTGTDADGNAYYVIDGVPNDVSEGSMLSCVDATTGERKTMLASQFTVTSIESVEDVMNNRYIEMFSAEIEQERLRSLINIYEQLESPAEEDVEPIMNDFGVPKMDAGAAIKLTDGREGVVDSYLGTGKYLVRVIGAQGVEVAEVPFYSILSSDTLTQQVQGMMLVDRAHEEASTDEGQPTNEGGEIRAESPTPELAQSEQPASEVEAQQGNVNVVEDIASVPTREDGSIDYDAIESPEQYAQLYKQEAGSVENAIADTQEMREAVEREIAKEEERAQKASSPNVKLDARKKAEALRQRVSFFDRVLEILTPADEITTNEPIPVAPQVETPQVDEVETMEMPRFKEGDTVKVNGRLATIVDASEEGVYTVDYNQMRDSSDVSKMSLAAVLAEDVEAAEEETVEEDAPKALEVGLVQSNEAARLKANWRKALDDVAKAFGVELHIEREVRDAEGKRVGGYIDGRRVYIEVNNKSNPLWFLVGHEVGHRMKDLAPEVFEQFKQSVMSFIGKKAWNTRKNKMVLLYEAHGKSYDDALIEEEVVADVIGQLVQNENLFMRYAKKNANNNVLMRALRHVLNVISKVLARIGIIKESRHLNGLIDKLKVLMDSAIEAQNRGAEVENDQQRDYLIGERGTANLDIDEEATVRLDNLAIAREMEAAGTDAETIKRATGWERGADSLWRYEVDDNITSVMIDTLRERGDEGMPLVEMLGAEHPLMVAYPELHDVRTVMLPYSGEGYGAFIPERHELVMFDTELNMPTLAHELQHAVQTMEGFAVGGSPMYMKPDISKDVANYQQVIPNALNGATMRVDDASLIDAEKFAQAVEGLELGGTAKRYADWLKAQGNITYDDAVAEYNRLLSEVSAELEDARFEMYERISGEVEARNVARRLGMTPEERRTTLARLTEDVAREEQLFFERASAITDEESIELDDLLMSAERPKQSEAKENARFYLIGEHGAAALDMAEEATTRLDNLNIAREMETAGKDAKAIRMATGWERGADGLWRYEIMDAEVNLYDGNENTIRKKIEAAEEEEKDFMQQSKADTKELRERTNAYLAEMREKYGVAEGEETDAMTEEEIAHLQSLTNKEIEFEDYKERRRNELYNRRMALEAQLAYVSVKKSEATAEIATTRLGHILQGNDAEVLFAAYPSLRDIEVQFVTDIRDGAFAAYATKGGYKRIELNAKKTPVDMLAPYISHEVQHAIQDIEGFAGGGNLSSLQSDENVTAKEAYDYYRKIAGEVEARNVSARINMTPDERRATLLSETEDVAREDQIFLREGVDMAMAEKKKSADETVSPNNSDHSTAISSADGAKVLKKLDNLAKKYQEKSNRPHTFIGDVAEALGINMPNKSSKYGTYETMSGDMVTIRLSNHNATASNLDAMGEDEAISIVVTNKPNNWLVNDGESHIIEFYYNSIALGKADGKPLVDIINSLKQTLYSGKYVDKTGLAQVQEINPRYSLITPEMDASYLDAVERGDMATAQRMVLEAAKLAMPDTKVVDEDGTPKVVYHGTPNYFNAFSKEMFGTSTDRGIWGNGFYFSEDAGYAKQYQKRNGADGRTLSLFLNLKNPLFISLRDGGNEGAMYFHQLNEKYFTDDIFEDATKVDENMKVAQQQLSDNLIADGYDGVVIEYSHPTIAQEYVAFNPNQIKSADPVTYDDNGNVIPLSERFNPKKEDIRYRLSEETTKIFDAAKAKFGTTYDMREAGYILPDGSMLDFSGRHQVEGDTSFLNGDRTVDHREIADIAYDSDDNDTGVTTDLGDFLDRGAIRIDYNAGAINLNVAPTRAQKDRLKRLIERNDGYVYIDFGKGWDTEHYAEYEAARASRVLGDIDRYFDEGIKPTGNVRFSLQEDTRYALPDIIDMTDEEAYMMQTLEIAQSMEQEASERNLDVAQEIVDSTGWVHLASGEWKYYGYIKLTGEAKKNRRVQRWLESKRAIAKARVKKMYDALIREARLAARELGETQNVEYTKLRSNADKVDYILQGVAREALPIEDQVLVDIALGLRLKWSDGDGKRGLKTELGLESSRREKMGAVTIGATTYLEDYVEGLHERNNGYENNIDDNDIRNAVISAIGSYPSPKAALEELYSRYKPDSATQEAEEGIARLEFEQDEALSEIDANHRATMEDFEQNPDKYEREYAESEAWNAEIDLYENTLSKTRHQLQSLENKMARTSASERERKATIANIKRQIIAQLEGDLGRYAYKNDIRALINAVNEAQTTYAMLRAFDKAMRAMYELKLRKELSRMRNLTKMQIVAGDGSILDPRIFLNNMVAAGEMTQAMAHRTLQSFWGGFNNSGVPIAKGVDAETKELMEFIHQNSDYVTAMAKQKGDNARKYVETLRSELEADTALPKEARDKRMAATYIIEQYLEAQETYERIRMSKDAQTRQSDINALTKKIRSIKAEIEKTEKEPVRVKESGYIVARKDELKKLEAELNKELISLLRERAENSDNYFGSMPDIITLLEEANASVITLLQEGKVELSKQKEAERKHRQELIHDALADMDGYIDAANSLGKEKPAMQKTREEVVSALTVPFKSIDHLLREMSKYAPNGEGRLWQRFIPVLFKATQNIHTDLRNDAKDINEMAAALFGKSYDKVVKLAETTVIGTFNVPSSAAKGVNLDGTTSTKPAIETRKLTVTQAMNILATWAQEEGRRTLERDGFNDKTINEIRSRMREANPNWEVFMNWVVDSYLPSLRPKYSEAFKVLFGSKMPFVKKYFPLRRVGVAKPADIANEGPLPLPSTVTGSVISRTGSTASIDLNSSFFEVLQENVVEMEVWAEMAPIIKDFNILMSSPAVKNAMNAIREGFATDFRKAAKVATLSESLEHGEMEKYLMPLITKTWAGSKLALKGYTALKQLSSSILFAGYSTDPEFIGILMWRYATGGLPLPNKAMRSKIANGEIKLNAKDFFKVPLTRNILWAMEHSQAFANRWFSGAAGNETLAKKIADPKWQDKTWLTSVRKGVEETLSKGMLGIVVVDAFTVATGMRAIYDYEVEKGKSRGLTDAQAKELAIFKADYFANKTQQSSEGLLLSPMQTARDFISTTLSTFNNAPFAQGRIILESIRELRRNKEREIMHIEYEYQKRIVESRSSELDAEVEMMKQRGELTNKLDEEKYRDDRTKQMMQEAYPDAHAYAMRERRRVRGTAILRLFLNAYLGPLAFNAMAILPYLVFGDDGEKKWDLVWTILWASLAGPLSAIPLGSAFLSLFSGYDFTVSGALSELERDINNIATYIRENGFDWTLMGLISDFAVRRTIGLDYRAVYNMYAGIEDMIQNGASAEGVMMAMNAPMSQVRLIAGDRKDNETFKQYSERLMRLYTILQTPAHDEYFRNDRGLKSTEPPLGMKKWEMREIKSSYEQQHRRDVMQQFGGEGAYNAMLEAETEYAQIIENFGWTTRSVTPHVEDDGTLNIPVSGISEEEYRELIGLARAINRTDRMLQRFIGEDSSYYEVLSQMNNLRNQFIAKYHESIE